MEVGCVGVVGLWEIMGVCGIVGEIRTTCSYGVQTEVKMASGTIKTRVGLVCGVQTEVMMASVTIEPLGRGLSMSSYVDVRSSHHSCRKTSITLDPLTFSL